MGIVSLMSPFSGDCVVWLSVHHRANKVPVCYKMPYLQRTTEILKCVKNKNKQLRCLGNNGRRGKASSAVPWAALRLYQAPCLADTWAGVCSAPAESRRKRPLPCFSPWLAWETKAKSSLLLPPITLQQIHHMPSDHQKPSQNGAICSRINAQLAHEGLGAYGRTEMLNTSSILIYLWLLQPTVTTSSNWTALGRAKLICCLIIKPGPLLIMASLETTRLAEKCIQGAVLTPKAHAAPRAQQDLCQMQISCWRLKTRSSWPPVPMLDCLPTLALLSLSVLSRMANSSFFYSSWFCEGCGSPPVQSAAASSCPQVKSSI